MLQSWLSFTPDRTEFGYLVDPIRTRAYFIGRRKPTAQVRVGKAWVAESKLYVAELEREADDTSRDLLTEAAFLNLIYLARARQEWLKKLLSTVRGTAKREEGASESAVTS